MKKCWKKALFAALIVLLLLAGGGYLAYRLLFWQGFESIALPSDAAGSLPAQLTFEPDSEYDGIRIVRFCGLFHEGEIIIPETISGRAVTAIAPGAFNWVEGLTELHLPTSLQSIGDEAFAHNHDLRTIFLPAAANPETGKDLFTGSPAQTFTRTP